MFNFKIFNPFASTRIKPTFPSAVSMREYNGRKYIRKMPVQTKNDTVYLESFPISDSTLTRTEIYNSYKSSYPIAYHEYDIHNTFGQLSGMNMQTDLSHRKQGLGELLRLVSIIEMKENNLSRNIIHSLPAVVKFHYKYGFRPDITGDERSVAVLNDIVGRSDDEFLINKAKALINEIRKQGYISETQCAQSNDIINRYINKMGISGTSPIFDNGFELILTDKFINENSSFYNNLFAKHGIDYKV